MDILIKGIILMFYGIFGILSLPIVLVLTVILYALDIAHKEMK